MRMNTDLYQQAEWFINQAYAELQLPEPELRLKAIQNEIHATGTYRHTFQELEQGVRMAWRNSNRCIGRLFWKSLVLHDQRDICTTNEMFSALEAHLQTATNGGKIIPLITVFPPQQPDGVTPFRIWNKNLIRYAAHRQPDGSVMGDPEQLELTQLCKKWGWQGTHHAFDVLPLVVQQHGKNPEWRALPPQQVLEVRLTHPQYSWFEKLDLRWHAVPVISDMVLEIGGIRYPAAPFNGWYMITEIGSRNLGDEKRYNQLPKIAAALGWNTSKQDPFWKDKALVILNEAVFYSFKQAGVTITDHHAASEQFTKFIRNEASEGRSITADWAWIVPPLSASSLKVFHQEYSNEVISPNFFYTDAAWDTAAKESRCPFHIASRKS